ncbi:MAG: type VI secretion system membrane subunit TssM [Polyangiales bacterium]
MMGVAPLVGGLLLVVSAAGVLALVLRALRRRRAARDVEAALRASMPEALSTPDAKTLALEIATALAEARRRGPCAKLPRYLVLGAPRAGKRGVIAGANLARTSGDTGDAVWLAQEALLVRVDASHQDQLGQALEVLRRNRRRRPLDGVVACIDVALLRDEDDAAREAYARALRAQLALLIDRLGACPPAYVVLTKGDRLPGFSATSDGLTTDERRRPWGFALPALDGGARSDEIARRLARLVQVVERRAILSMTAPRTLEACTAVYALPAALAALDAPLRCVIDAAFARDAHGSAPLLRGVYLTGVAERGADACGVDVLATGRPSREGHERLFLRELFARVILPDAGLLRLSLPRSVRRRRGALSAALGLGLLAACFTWFEARAYRHNQRAIDDVRRALHAARRDGAIDAQQLEPLRRSVHTLATHARDGIPASFGVGLYPGALLRPEVERLYASIIRDAWVAPYVRDLAASLAAPGDEAPSREGEHARIHALLERTLRWTRDAGPPPPRDEARTAWLLDDLRLAHPDASRAHLTTYLTLLDAHPELAVARDARWVGDARARLRGLPMASLAVDRIEAQLAARGPALSVETLLGTTSPPLVGGGVVPFAFSARGFHEHVRGLLDAPPDALIGASWVLGDAGADEADTARAARVCALRSAYFARYVERWRGLLGGLRITSPRDASSALATLKALTHGEPPALERLATEVARNAVLEPASKPADVQAAPAHGWLERVESTLGSTARAASPDARTVVCDAPGTHDAASVRAALRGFARFGVPEKSEASEAAGTPPVTASQLYHEQLAFVRDAMQTHQLDPRDPEPLLARLGTAEGAVRQLVDAQEIGWRPRFAALLMPPLLAARVATSGDLARQRSESWCTDVVAPFARTLAGRYPFVRGGRDATLADLVAFYRPMQGIVWSAYEALLAHDLQRSGEHFVTRPGAPLARRYRAQLPSFLQRAQAIARALFPEPGGPPRVAFDVRVRPTPGVASIALDVDGQRVDFHNGPERWVALHWPGDGPTRGATLRVRGADVDETIAQEGEWGLFRLLESGTVEARAGEPHFGVRFRLRTQRDVVLEVRPARAEQPLLGPGGEPLEVFRARGVEAPRDIAEGVRGCR